MSQVHVSCLRLVAMDTVTTKTTQKTDKAQSAANGTPLTVAKQ